jgi:comEA protein
MNAPTFLQTYRFYAARIVAWVSVTKSPLIAGGIGLLIAGIATTTYWYRQPLRTQVQNWLDVRSATVAPSVSTPSTIEEQLQELRSKVDALAQQYQVDGQARQQLVNDFQAALHEVAGNNDQLAKQGQQLTVALQNVRAEMQALTTGQATDTATLVPSSPSTSASSPTTSGKVNINTATVAELDTLPGIGPSYAQSIIQYRTDHGPFHSIEELTNVKGIGEATLEKIKDKVTV